MFIVRNAGNMVPHSSKAGTEMTIWIVVGTQFNIQIAWWEIL
jgi:carbonic anhydrase